MNTKLHAVADAKGRPIGFFMSAGQVSDYTGAVALLGSLPKADWLLADRGYDADWLRDALKDKGMKVCIPGRKSRKKAVRYDKRRYKRRNRIEIMFGRLKGAVRQMRTGLRYPYPAYSSRGEQPAPLCESGGAGLLVGVAVLEMALRWKVVVDRGMDRRELL